jgi:hypothetical protein
MEDLEEYTCEKHGKVRAGWIPCTNLYCEDGFEDEYEMDAINFAPGSYTTCNECNGQGGHHVCSECCADNPDMEL